MKLNTAELVHVRSQGLYITEKCDGCGKLLNQTLRFTIAGKPEVYCSAACRDLVFFGDRREARKQSTPGKCVYCGAMLVGKRRGALYCDEVCKKRVARTGRAQSTAEPQITGTPSQLNQQVIDRKTGEQGNRTTGGPEPSEMRLTGPREMEAAGRIGTEHSGDPPSQLEDATASRASDTGGGWAEMRAVGRAACPERGSKSQCKKEG